MSGKFATETDAIVWDMSLSACDAECGDAQYGDGWHGLLTFNDGEAATVAASLGEDTMYAGAIIREDSQGFVDVDYYEEAATLASAWADVEAATNDDGE